MIAGDLRRAGRALREQALALNEEVVEKTAPLDAEGLEALLSQALAAPCLTEGDRLLGFLLGLPEGADYASANFAWFRARLPRFAYVDRVAVTPAARGRGVGRALHAAFAAAARASARDVLACEINEVPPNPGSHAFHRALGFRAIGHGSPAPGKRVVYYTRAAAPDAGH
ncbi:MAG: GNAT family N-acetyltransferase [Rhodobacteraceae bacterium]|nr:GNAT family N-acetyltransferase [Paracoccaceae bacterium]